MMAGKTTTVNRYAGRIKWISIGLLTVGFLMIARTLPLGRAVEALGVWMTGLGYWGPLIFGLIYVAATVLMLPGSVLTLAAGVIFGLWVGTITVSLAATTGAALAFLISRYLAREKVARAVSRKPRFNAVDKAIGEGGWKIVALLRLSPAIPFNLQNYLYGLTPIGFLPCVLASWAAMLPGTFMYVYIGHITGAAVGAERARTPAEWAALLVGLLATVVVTMYVTRLAKKKLNEQAVITDKAEPAPEHEENGARKQEAKGGTRGGVITAILGLLVFSTGLYVQFHPQFMGDMVARVFGPARVELREVYERKPGGPKFDHSGFDVLLHEYVDAAGWVDYEGLNKDAGKLDAYLAQVAEAPFADLGRDEKLTLLINAYNAFTLKLILERYPIESIMKVPDSQRWDAVRWKVGGNVWSLSQIEHEQIRPKFKEPRVHFALVCAAVGCPPLRGEAYDADRIDQQLEEQAQFVHHYKTWFDFEPGENIAHLTPLYRWYGSDFEQVAGSVVSHAARYSPDLREALESGKQPDIRWLQYDWKLNSPENRDSR